MHRNIHVAFISHIYIVATVKELIAWCISFRKSCPKGLKWPVTGARPAPFCGAKECRLENIGNTLNFIGPRMFTRKGGSLTEYRLHKLLLSSRYAVQCIRQGIVLQPTFLCPQNGAGLAPVTVISTPLDNSSRSCCIMLWAPSLWLQKSVHCTM